MIERTFDAAWFNRLCNLPEVRPGLGGEGKIDVSALVLDYANYALRTEHGGFILIGHGAGVYSVHSQFSKEGRGRHAIQAMKAGLEYMFTRTDCMRIFSHCPDDNPAALGLAKAGNAAMWFRKNDPLLGPGQVVRWDALEWMTAEPENEAFGNVFHEMLETAKAENGSELPKHEDDPWHDRAVGAAVMMCARGQAAKGVALYNIWSAAAGYQMVKLLSQNPPLVDVGDGVVGLNAAGELEVLLCR